MTGVITVLLVLTCGLADRVRGGWEPFKKVPGTIRTVAYGWLFAAMFGHEWDYLTAPFLILFRLGESFGWGSPMARALGEQRLGYESWQVGALRDNHWLALAVRGAMWGGPVALLATLGDYSMLIMLPAFVLAMTLAPYTVWRVNGRRPSGNKWAEVEILRGWIAGVCVAVGLRVLESGI